MNHMHGLEHSSNNLATPPFWQSRYGLGLLIFGGIAAYFLLTEHLAHVVGALPILLLLACPLMHVFMHHGHGTHDHQGNPESKPEDDKNTLSKPGSPS